RTVAGRAKQSSEEEFVHSRVKRFNQPPVWRNSKGRGKAKFFQSKRSEKETSLDPCCSSDFIHYTELKTLPFLEPTSVAVCC
ncbi:hypothetical protein AMECASPLE_010785, partial [Ameca splendens]